MGYRFGKTCWRRIDIDINTRFLRKGKGKEVFELSGFDLDFKMYQEYFWVGFENSLTGTGTKKEDGDFEVRGYSI